MAPERSVTTRPGEWRRTGYSHALWIMIVAGVAASFAVPYLHYVDWFGDEGVLLRGAIAMIDGNALYRDIFAFLAPGGYYLTKMWAELVGQSLVAFRSLAVLMTVVTAIFTYCACAGASRSRALAAVLTLGWVMCSQGDWTVVNHHSITTLFGIAALCFAESAVAGGKSRTLAFVSGMCAGMAGMVTQHRGAAIFAATLGGMILAKDRRNVLAVLGGTAVPVLMLCAALLLDGTFVDAFQSVILLTLKRYASIQALPFGSGADIQTLPLVVIFPVTAAVFLIGLCVSPRALLAKPAPRLCIGFAAAGFLGAFPRPDIMHLAVNVPLILPLFCHCVHVVRNRFSAPGVELVMAFLVVLALVPSYRVYAWHSNWVTRAPTVNTPRGEIKLGADANSEDIAGLFRAIAAIDPHSRAFFYPYLPMLAYLSDRDQVGPYDIFTPHYTLPEEYRRACEAVLSTADFLILDRKWMSPAWLKSVFPAMRDGDSLESREFERILLSHFEYQTRFGDFEIRRRIAGMGEAGCDESPAR